MITYQKQIEVKYETEILVIGGGPAGVSAAVTAARAGKKVLLVENMGALGGLGTIGRIPMFCQFSDGVNFLSGGFGKEVHSLCLQNGAVSPDDYETHDKKRESISINSEKLKKIYDKLTIDAGVQVSFFTKVIDVVREGEKITYVICSGRSSVFAIKANVYIDCSGDADVCYYAGAECKKGDEEGNMQAGTLCSLWTDIDWDTVKEEGFQELWPRNDCFIEQAYRDGVFERWDKGLPGMWRVGKTTGGGNIGHAFMVDGTDEVSLTKAMLESRKLLEQYEVYYKKYLRGFEDMELADTGSILGIRESRRVMGDYVLTADDYFARAVFDDEIGRYNYAIDSHPPKCDPEYYKEFSRMFKQGYQDGESYGIPYRTLTPRGISNLLVAGRCISTDRNMQSSVRVMPGCFITGQAAGMAAAMSVDKQCDVHCIDVKALQKALAELGAYLPNRR